LEGWARSVGVVVFSIIGMVGVLRIVDKGDTTSAKLMLLAGVVLISLAYSQLCYFSLARRLSY